MKPIIFLILLLGLTAGMVFTSSMWLTYGNPDVTIFGMILIAVLLEMNTMQDKNDMMVTEDGEIDNSKILFMLIFSVGVMYGLAAFISFITATWVTAAVLSFYLVKSALLFVMGDITPKEDTA